MLIFSDPNEEEQFGFSETNKDGPLVEDFGEILKETQKTKASNSPNLDMRVVEGVCGPEGSNNLENLDSFAGLPLDAVQHLGEAAWEAQSEIGKRIQRLEPLISTATATVTATAAAAAAAATNVVETKGEITDEQLDAIGERLNQLQGSEHIEDMKVFSEVETKRKFPESNSSSPPILKSSKPAVTEILKESNLQVDKPKPIEATSMPTSYAKASPEAVSRPSSQIKQSDFADNVLQTPATPKLIGRKPLAKTKAKSTVRIYMFNSYRLIIK